MTNLHPNFLIKNGEKEFVVLPYKEFVDVQEILEDYADLRDLRMAKAKEKHTKTLSLSEAKKRLKI